MALIATICIAVSVSVRLVRFVTIDCWDSKNDKPIFKKPEKRPSSDKDVKKSAKKKKTDVKAVKNSKLLSFDEEDDEG